MQKTNDITVNSIPRRRVKERGSWYITADTVTGNSILKFTNITVRDTFPIERALVYDSWNVTVNNAKQKEYSHVWTDVPGIFVKNKIEEVKNISALKNNASELVIKFFLLKWLCKETFAVAREQSVAITKNPYVPPLERHYIKPYDNL